jgi:hypothetical protein
LLVVAVVPDILVVVGTAVAVAVQEVFNGLLV